MPTDRLTRPPQIMRQRMSRPSSSVPSQCGPLHAESGFLTAAALACLYHAGACDFPARSFSSKPNATNDVRGPYGNIATSVPGIQICELLPMLAERMDRYALIRSLTGFTGGHMARPALTGAVESLTTYGAVVTKLQDHAGAMPPYIHLGGKIFNTPGIGGGVLGSAYDPVEILDPLGKQVQLPNFSLSADVSAGRYTDVADDQLEDFVGQLGRRAARQAKSAS